jgi:hypothetical protein
MYATAPKEVLEARPGAIRFAKEIGAFANKKWEKGAAMAGLVASLTFQNILTSIMVSIYPPGSKEGEEELRKVYEGALKDAVIRWHEPDLKHWFAQKHNKT